MKKYKTTTFPDISLELTPENVYTELNKLACTNANEILSELDFEKAVELAFALLQMYFNLTYLRSCPLIKCGKPEQLDTSLRTLANILDSCDITLETNISTFQA